MAPNALTAILVNVALFDGLSEAQIAEISRVGERVLFQEGAALATRGDPCDAAIVVVDGALECTEGVAAEAQLDANQTGCLIGEMAMFIEDYRHQATFVARTPTKALLLHRSAIRSCIESDPTLAEQFVANIAARLKQTCVELQDVETPLRPAEPAQSTPAAAEG